MKKTYSVPPDEQIERMSFSQINSLISDVLNTAQKVKDKTEHLPKVENNPESRTFSEKEYAEKDELAEQLKLKIETLDRVRLYLEYSRDQAYNELQVVSANQTRLHSDKPKREFSEAEALLAHQYKQIVDILDRLQKAFDIAQKILAQAFSKRFPGSLPRKDPKLDVNPFDAREIEKRKLNDDLNREIKNALEIT